MKKKVINLKNNTIKTNIGKSSDLSPASEVKKTKGPGRKFFYNDISYKAYIDFLNKKHDTESGLCGFYNPVEKKIVFLTDASHINTARHHDLFKGSGKLKDNWFGFNINRNPNNPKLAYIRPQSIKLGAIPVEHKKNFEKLISKVFTKHFDAISVLSFMYDTEGVDPKDAVNMLYNKPPNSGLLSIIKERLSKTIRSLKILMIK